MEICPLDEHKTIPKITEDGFSNSVKKHIQSLNLMSYCCYVSHIFSHLTHWPLPECFLSSGFTQWCCANLCCSSSLFVMKATECGEGRLHRSQLRSAGQSEEETSAYRPPQVAEDHQDTGKISFNACQLVWPDFWNDPHGVDKDWVIPTVAMPGETESSSCPSFVCSKELMFDSARCWRYCNPPAHTHTNAHAQRSAYNWFERSNAQKINPSLKVSCNIWRYLIMNDALLFIFFDVFYQLHL